MKGALIVVAGGVRLGISLADVSRIVVETAVAPVPFAHRALAGVMRVAELDDAIVPVFDLRGFDGAERLTRQAGKNVAVIPTARGPVGLRLEGLLGTAGSYVAVAVDAAALERLPAALRASIAGCGRPDGEAGAIGVEDFYFFSPEAFIHELGLAGPT